MKVVKTYHGCRVVAENVGDDPLPWMFSVEYDGTTHRYAGIPNKCHSCRSALRRGWWRAKWLNEGTYDQRYQPMNVI